MLSAEDIKINEKQLLALRSHQLRSLCVDTRMFHSEGRLSFSHPDSLIAALEMVLIV